MTAVVALLHAVTVVGVQALARGSKSEEPTMRLLRLVMLGVALLLIGLTAITWQRSLYVSDYTISDAWSIHLEGHRGYIIEVGLSVASHVDSSGSG